MSRTSKKGCYTVYSPTDGVWYGRCDDFPGVEHAARTRDAAGSGIRRKVKRLRKGEALPISQTAAPSGKTQNEARKVNRIVFVVDRSGSMNWLTLASVRALNSNIAEVKKQARATGQETFLSIIRFDTEKEIILDQAAVENVREFNRYDFAARGGTALFDATAAGIRSLETARLGDASADVTYLVVVVTDGEENSSKEFTASTLRDLMQRVQSTDRWTLSFLLPPGRKGAFVRQFGIPEGNVAEWEGTEHGVMMAASSTQSGIGTYYQARSMGLTNVGHSNALNFFQTDLSNVKAGDLKRNLVDVSPDARVLTVEKEENIREFVERKLGKPMLKGSAFYQLTKGEKKVQDYKQILVMEKGKRSIYGGDDARSVLGIPSGNLRVSPGNHSNFDLFVQSTSVNRKLVRGTKLVYIEKIGVPFAEGPSAPRAAARSRR